MMSSGARRHHSPVEACQLLHVGHPVNRSPQWSISMRPPPQRSHLSLLMPGVSFLIFAYGAKPPDQRFPLQRRHNDEKRTAPPHSRPDSRLGSFRCQSHSAERTFARNCTEPVANRKDRLFKRFEQRHVPLRLSTKRPRLCAVLEGKTWIEIPRLG